MSAIKDKKDTLVIVGLSGGVDSASSCIKLIEEGYHVEAMYMRNWDSALNNDLRGNPTVMDEVCPQEKDYQDAGCEIAERYRKEKLRPQWSEFFYTNNEIALIIDYKLRYV